MFGIGSGATVGIAPLRTSNVGALFELIGLIGGKTPSLSRLGSRLYEGTESLNSGAADGGGGGTLSTTPLTILMSAGLKESLANAS